MNDESEIKEICKKCNIDIDKCIDDINVIKSLIKNKNVTDCVFKDLILSADDFLKTQGVITNEISN